MNYGELKAQFEGLLKRRDMTPTQRDAFLSQGIARAQRVLRIPPMEKSVEIIYDEDEFEGGEIPIPNDFLRLKAMTVGKNELKAKDLTTVLSTSDIVGTPTAYTRRGGYWKLDRLPEIGTAIRFDFYAEFPELTNDSDENYITRAASDVAIYGALSYAGDWFIDRRQPAWEARFLSIVGELTDQSDQDELVNSNSSPAYFYPED